jgi:flagellar hook-associated protein 1 FlgK
MSSTFFGIGVAYSGLSAQSKAIEVLGYNVAHANDPTYKRQRVVFKEGSVLAQASEATLTGVSNLGTGVNAGDVQRIYDALIDNRLRNATQASAKWEYRYSALTQLEATIGEPSDTGLQNDLSKFWASWQKVADQPASLSIRSTLLDDASALCQRLQNTYMQIKSMGSDLNTAVRDRVNQINIIGNEIARLNVEIAGLQQDRIPVNDLQNRRDALLGELSKLTDITTHGDGADGVIVSIGGQTLVQGGLFSELKCQVGEDGNLNVEWASNGQPLLVSDGELRAMLDLRDTEIPGYLSQLDNIAVNLVTMVNAAHRTGKTLDGDDGGDFFRPNTTAANISLDDSIANQPKLVAASLSGDTGDNTVALAIADLASATTANGLTIDQLYRAFVGDIGSSASAAKTQSTAYKLSVDQFTTQQQSVSGVSLDEEMTNLIKLVISSSRDTPDTDCCWVVNWSTESL